MSEDRRTEKPTLPVHLVSKLIVQGTMHLGCEKGDREMAQWVTRLLCEASVQIPSTCVKKEARRPGEAETGGSLGLAG